MSPANPTEAASSAHSGETLLHVALQRLERLDPESERWEAELSPLSMGVVDALLAADTDALAAAVDPLRDALARLFDDAGHAREIRGWLLCALTATHSALDRLPSRDELKLARDTMAWRMLASLQHGARGGTELSEQLGTNASQISRAGRDLLARDLVVQRRIGRRVRWELAPRGRQVLSAASEAGPPRDRDGGERRRPRSAG